MHIGQVADQYRSPVNVLHHNISEFLQIIDKADTAYYICLRTFGDDVSTYIDITVGNGIIKFQRSNAVVDELVRVDAYLECLDLSTETYNIRYARYGTQIALNHPVLKRFQLTHTPLIAAQGIAINLTRRSIKRLYFGSHSFRQVSVVQQIIDLLAGREVIYLILKHHIDH